MKIFCRALIAFPVWAYFLTQAAAAGDLCQDPKTTHQLEASTTGEVIEGPACVQVMINGLRYSGVLVKAISFSAGPNLTSIFPEQAKPLGADKCAPGAPVSLEQAFQQISERVNGGACTQGITKQLADKQSDNRRFAADVEKALTNLKNSIIQSDEILSASGPAGVLKLVKSDDFQNRLDEAIVSANSWKATDNFLDDIHAAQQALAVLPQSFAQPPSGTRTGPTCDTAVWQEWYTQCGGESRYKLLQDRLAKLESDAQQMASGTDPALKIAKQAGLLAYWKNLTSTLALMSFQLQVRAPCGVLFNQNKQTAIKLALTDRIALFDGQVPQTQVKDPLVTVQCGSPFSISAGVGFSTIEDRAFALVKSAPSDGGNSVVRFGESTRSPVHPMPLAMAHARLQEWDNKYALHASFGVAAAIKGQDSGGSNAEYLTGLSVSFYRTIYLTGGLHIGQQASLAGGFKVNDIVPPDITEPPIQKGYKVGFGFAVTFTKP